MLGFFPKGEAKHEESPLTKTCPLVQVEGLQMYCSYCGSNNSEGSKFCLNCGKPLKEVANAPAQYAAAAVNAPATAPAPAVNSCSKGCFASAWEDVRNSDGWMGKMFLLGLIMLVPILNFFVPGYALGWAKEIACGKRAAMPKKIFADGAFALGFFSVIFGLVFGLLIWIVSIPLNLIPLLGTAASIVLSIFGSMFVSVCVLRIAISGRLGAGFDFSSIWQAYGRNLGALFCASILPGLVIELVAGAIATCLVVLAAMVSGVGVTAFMYGYRGSLYASSAGVGAVVVAVILVAVALYIMFVASSLVSVVSYRAVGHWVSRTAPNWASELGAQPYVAPAQPVQHASCYVVPAVAPTPAPAASSPAPAQAAPVATPAPQPAPCAPHSADDSGTTDLSSLGNEGDSSTTVLADDPAKTLVLIRSDGAEVRVSAFPATLGKGTAADIQISGNNSISRVHARVIAANGSFAIEDLGSTNKTHINDNPLEVGEVVALHCGDELKLGSENLIVRF